MMELGPPEQFRASNSPIRAKAGFVGQVTDLATGQPIAGALVVAGEARALSDAQGRYHLPLPPGTYDVHASAQGYIGMTHVWRRIRPGTVTPLDFEMVPRHPTPAQAAIIEARLVVPGQALPDPKALRLARERGFAPSGVTRVPATVRVLMPDGTVARLDMDEYLKGVVPHEMAPHWPPEALKAQAMAARSYAATETKLRHLGADVDTTTRTQVWRPTHYDTTDQAVEETHGLAPLYDGNLIRAFFFAHCDGRTRSSHEVWGTYVPYLLSVDCPDPYTDLYGHGVGLCQRGAQTFAEWGASYQEILTHYYTGVEVPLPGTPTLSDEGVTPTEGHTATPFTFQVTYRDPDGDPPTVADLYLDGRAYAMRHVEGDYRTGARYVYTTTLSAEEHTYSFHFDDGYNPVVSTPTLDGPTVMAGPAPTPTSVPPGTVAGTLRQTTRLDFADGRFDGLDLVGDEDAQLLLAEGRATGVYTSAVLQADLPFMAVGSRWQADLPPGTRLHLELRASDDKRSRSFVSLPAFSPDLRDRLSEDGSAWSQWVTVPPADAQRWRREDDWGDLVFLVGQYLQYRITLSAETPGAAPSLDGLTLITIDARPGPTAAQALDRASLRATQEPVIISRAEWGCPEPDSSVDWPPEYREPRVFIVHHTVTPNDPVDPAAMVRAIYYYHAVTRGWGDIGYNFLVDQWGNIYQGRYPGDPPEGQIVVGGHALHYNYGSIGVALLGTYQEVDVPEGAQDGLAELLAWQGNQYFIHPLEEVFFIDDVFPTIMGHRDVLPTTCPGDRAYLLLPQIRNQVLARMGELPPHVEIVAPEEGAALWGTVAILPRVSPAVTSVDFYADGELLGTDEAAPFRWDWDTAQEPDGEHTIRVVARTAAGLTDEDAITVTVDSALAQPCSERVVNGDFEAVDVGWEPLGGQPGVYSTLQYHSPTRSMFLGLAEGMPDVVSWSSVQQQITIPADAVVATLTFWYYPISEDFEGDVQRFGIRDAEGMFLAPLQTLPNQDARAWQFYEIDLLAYVGEDIKGQTITLYFNVYNDGDGQGVTSMYLDDVSVLACREAPTPTPTMTATATSTATSTPTATFTPTPTATSTATATVTPSPTSGTPATLPPTLTATATATSTPSPTMTATPTPTIEVTPTPTATPGIGCSELVVNGGFEGGMAPWTPNRASVVPAPEEEGHALLVGLTDPSQDAFAYSSAYQDVAIPAEVITAVLSFRYYPLSQDPERDRQIVELRDPAGGQLERLLGTGPASDSQRWEQAQFDLAEHHAGRAIRLYFGALNHEGGGVTAMYLDDVSVHVCRERLPGEHAIYLPSILKD
ncbi:MAG: SpoIID/LytB domain-containing protein [Anaerolineae bacterium]